MKIIIELGENLSLDAIISYTKAIKIDDELIVSVKYEN